MSLYAVQVFTHQQEFAIYAYGLHHDRAYAVGVENTKQFSKVVLF